MKSISKLLLLLLSTATVVPMSNPPTAQTTPKPDAEKKVISQEEVSKLHWIGIFTSLWLVKLSLKDCLVPGSGMLLAPGLIADLVIQSIPEQSRAGITRDNMIQQMKIQGAVMTSAGILGTYLSTKLTWFFIKKKLQSLKTK